MQEVKYPEIEVQLVGGDSNAFAIIGAVKSALRKAGVSAQQQRQFTDEAMSGDYDNVLRTAMKWVEVS